MDLYQLLLSSLLWTIFQNIESPVAELIEKNSIPRHLIDCYRWPLPTILPMTANNLIEIIRKININSLTPTTVAQEAADILHWFSIDGLERDPNIPSYQWDVIPYHRTGFQALKQGLVFEKLIPQRRRSFDEILLTPSEKCTLHFMVSATVDPWERGNERQTCPNLHEEFSDQGEERARYSCCPVEGGTVMTNGGTVSMGTVLAGVSASLAPENVPLSELMSAHSPLVHSAASINNVWATTLAGDLAEVAVLQAPQYKMDVNIGMSEEWNNTYIPSVLYFSNVRYSMIKQHNWQITNAEILGGIDGLLIGQRAAEWKHEMPGLRLSQLLDLYYLNTIVREDFHVCKRESAFNNYIRDKKKTLTEQTQNFAALLTTKATDYYIDSGVVEERSIKTVQRFMKYYNSLLGVEKCPHHKLPSRFNTVVILDATWTSYSNLQFVFTLAQNTDISYYGGSLAVINGDSEHNPVNSTASLSQIYQQMKTNQQDPIGLILHRPLLKLRKLISEESLREKNVPYPREAKQDVTLVVGFSSTISDKDLELSRDVLETIKSENPAMLFVYWTSPTNSQRFATFTGVLHSQQDSIVTTDDSRLETVLPKLQHTFESISAKILKPAYCKNDLHKWPESLYDESISPGQSTTYWIHPAYLCGSLDIVKITFKNQEYGELLVCMSRDDAYQGDCKQVKVKEEVTHALMRPCQNQEELSHHRQWDPGCRPIYITVSGRQSTKKCIENTCRYPDDIKFSIIVQDLHCISVNSPVCSEASTTNQFFKVLAFISTLVLTKGVLLNTFI